MRDMIALTLTLFVLGAAAEDIFEGAPAAPPGFKTADEAKAAVVSGKIPPIPMAPPVPDTVQAYKDIEYAKHDGKSLKLDVFVPKNLAAPAPLLVFVHGGGWRKGKKEDYLYYNLNFAKIGYVTASIQYRLSPESNFPAAIQDVECAIAWLKGHAADYSINPANVALLGGSAGGHLVMLAAYSQDSALLCPESSEDTLIKAVVNFYGVADLTVPMAQETQSVIDFIGKPYGEAADAYRQASPLNHLDKNDPPTLTFHGTIDELVPVEQAVELHAKLDELGIKNYFDRIEGWPHTMDLAKPINDRTCYVIERFLNLYMPAPQFK